MSDEEAMRGYDPSKLLTWVLGVVGTITATGVLAGAGLLISMGNRLSGIEATINENRIERQGQIQDLRERVSRLEVRVYRELERDGPD